VAEPLQQADRGVPDNGRAQVPDVHLLRDVRGGVVDHDRLRVADRRDAQAVPGRHGADQRGEGLVGQGEVDEPRPGDLHPGAQVGEIGPRHHLRGDLARRATQSAAEGESAVGLEVGVLRPAQAGVGRGAGDRRERRCEPFVQQLLQGRHEASI
jgi:hypothetical protein